ncbi:hypothetical protein KUL150_10170 [Alteromonas sp. KUL150]|uniref:hypothetical protein n=1 Tax=Alteromonas sp. KUL150 TaxID=2480805 RepID=UPI0012E5D9D1|nr:hypothetical protein [Alteromonas sp. KUL150]GFD84958.1 hypothetical protein KUL150_10170 [Alteromonas sp. KUL150]
MSEGKQLVEDESTALDKIIHYFPYFAISITILMFAIYFIRFHGGLGDHNAFGTFGDFFGGILNPMLTFFTILLLLRQLRYQRSELYATVRELQNTAKIHKETINHNRAVDIYEKTSNTFEMSLAHFFESLDYNFVKIPASGDDVVPLGGLQIPKDRIIRKINNKVSLNTLLPQWALVKPVLDSDKAENFINHLRAALNRTVRHGNKVYTLANTYQQLEVNNLLYLEKFKRFNDKLISLQTHIKALKLKKDAAPVTEELDILIGDSRSLIVRAENPQT